MRTLQVILLLLVCSVLVGCNSHNNQVNAFQTEVKKTIDPRVLQNWAMMVASTNAIGTEIPGSELPTFLRLTNTLTSVDVSGFSYTKSKLVFLSCGSGFRHWGLIVGDTNFVARDQSNLKLSLWRPGIYFYAETK